MTPYHDPLHCYGALPFALLISKILEDVGFEFNPSLGVQVSHMLIDVNSQAKQYSHVYGPMVLLAQNVVQEAFLEDDEIRAMEQEDLILEFDFPKLALHPCTSRGRGGPCHSPIQAYTFVDPSLQELLNSMMSLHLRMDAQDQAFTDQVCKIQGQLTYIIYWI